MVGFGRGLSSGSSAVRQKAIQSLRSSGFTPASAEDESWYRSAHHCSTVEDAVEGIREGNDMNKGYWVVAYRKVLDMATVKNYAALLVPSLGKFGGRMLVSPTGVVTAHEAGLQQMTIVVEFDNYEIALAAYESDDHKKMLAALGSGVERDFRIVEGV
jgi:uncharacterized protein (DUF1330 family)